MQQPRINRQWRLAARPVGLFRDSDFTYAQAPVSDLGDAQVLVRNLYLSIDPTLRGWASHDTYLPAVEIGEVMRSIAIGVVERSRHPELKEGDHVSGLLGWQDFAVHDGTGLNKLPVLPGVPLTAFHGLFGHIGLTAYAGLLDIGKPQAGETLVVSAAAGAVGSLAGQIGKIMGCRVVGIAGTDEKCEWITRELGFDAAINHKTENVAERLGVLCPNGIDIGFENVGGDILDAVLAHVNEHARIVMCGMISQYNNDGPVPGPSNFINIVVKRVRVEGFIVLDYLHLMDKALDDLGRWMMEGRLKHRIELVEGLEHAPSSVNRLFDGSHRGKLVVRV